MIDKNTNEIVAVGRRKRASARVRIKPGTGKFVVNGKEVKDYLERDVLVFLATQPFEATGTVGTFDVRARLGIARALVENDQNTQSTLRTAGFLTRDAREVERKKYGQPGARKRFQFSKR